MAEPEAAPSWPADAETMQTADYPNGLHARPASRWVEIARHFPCELRAYQDAEFADAKTQGSVGTRNTLSEDVIAVADVVIIAADTRVDTARFADKRIYEASTKAAIHDGAELVRKAIAEAKVVGVTGIASYDDQVKEAKAQQAAARPSFQDPLRVIPALMIGSAVTGAMAMVAGCELRAPHGGVFVLPIPNAVTNLGPYLIAIVAGTLVRTAALFFLKRPLEAKA